MLWLLLSLSAGGDLSGTWKVREPVVVETTYEVCRFRNVVAYVTHERAELTGRYEALVNCNDPNWPDDEWRKRIGTLKGSVEGRAVTVTIDDALLVLHGDTDGSTIRGSAEVLAQPVPVVWSARRLRR